LNEKKQIPFNKPFLCGLEKKYVEQVVMSGKLSGNGNFTHLCHEFFQQKFGFDNCLLTTSCTDALEMCAMLIDIQPGDEVIVPSFTFVSTALAFAAKGAKIVFADSSSNNPNIDAAYVRKLINSRTKAIVVMHYAGYACQMDVFRQLAAEHQLILIEDAALALDAMYNDRYLGSFGHLSTFSFHETKNIIAGEGGMLVVNDEKYINRAKVLWEKGTNRVDFAEGKAKKYEWVDLGSSFLPSELTAAFLFGQLQDFENIQLLRRNVWWHYANKLSELKAKETIDFPSICANASMFHFFVKEVTLRNSLLDYLQSNGIHAVFHYLPLHLSPFYLKSNKKMSLPNAEKYASGVVRVPFYAELQESEIDVVCEKIIQFFA